MDSITKLASYFAQFPGIGARQSKRFVYFLLSTNPEYVRTLAEEIGAIKKNVKQCNICFRYFQSENANKACPTCLDTKRDASILMVVEKNADFESILKSRIYNGLFFVLGALVPVVEKTTPSYVRINELKTRVKNEVEKGDLKEVVLAFSLNPQGENTDMFIRRELSSILENSNIKVSSLGRGLSTGTELEYSDTDTIKNALKNRQ